MMKIYLGSRDLKPEGYKSLDIDPERHPDILADISNMPQVKSGSCEELVASHVLEHLEWPDSFRAISEMARILRVGGVLRLAVPDMKALLELMSAHGNPFFACGMIFGAGGRTSKFEQHRYGFTAEMLVSILTALGFGDFDWWGSTLPEGANGWFQAGDEKIAVSLNVKAVKKGIPAVDCERLYARLCECPMREFDSVVADLLLGTEPANPTAVSPLVYQRIHFQLIEARQRIEFLEKELAKQTAGGNKKKIFGIM